MRSRTAARLTCSGLYVQLALLSSALTPVAAVAQPSDAGVSESPEPGAPTDAPRSYRAVAVAPAPAAHGELPNHVQRLDDSTLRAQHGWSLSEALNARLGSVTVNDVQGNPLQPDVQYRGFTASPLLGTPQGIAVYQDGVRLNEPFGDVTQWDLIPMFAVADVQLVPGENPAYGLNALGGSVVMRMKNAWNTRGVAIDASAGSFSRYRLTGEYGRVQDSWGGYAGASLFGEQGFRDHSQSNAQQLYADLRRLGADYEFGVGLTLAATDLLGNGPAPVELLRQRRAAVYTWPDLTRNQLVLVSVDGKRALTQHVALQGTLYLRHTVRSTANGDATDLAPCSAADSGNACDGDGEPLRSTLGTPVNAAPGFDAVFNRTHTVSNGFGGSVQVAVTAPLWGHTNRLSLGGSYDGSQVTFSQDTELGHLTVERSVVADGPALMGAGLQTELSVANHLFGLYALDTLQITDALALHASARFNWFRTALDDRLGTALSGQHVFVRVNPALGVTQRIGSALSLFASYGENSRAPSAAELACADPDAPCRLPNAFVSDPPLKQVVSRSAELGLRAHAGSKRARSWLSGSLAAFGIRNADDILFVAGSRIGTGYFRNAGRTQRIGVELALHGELARFSGYAAYTYLRATFESPLSVPRVAAEDDAGPQRVEPGSRIPGLPLHSVKAGVAVRITSQLEVGLDLRGQSSQPLRGDEANERAFVAGYVILDARASYRLLRELTLFVRAQNLLDTSYSTFGVVADPSEVLAGAENPRFLGPGAPLGVWAGVTFQAPR